MAEIVLNAEIREQFGKRAKRVRAGGGIPGIFYAHGEGNVPIQVSKLGLDPLIYTSEANVIDLRLPDGSSRRCILRDVQFDPVSDRPVHFDLQGLRENEKLTIEVPIILTGGIPVGVRDGGMIQHVIHRLRISCLPRDIPSKIEVNVAALQINQAVHVNDLPLAAGVTVLESPDSTVVSVVPPTVVKEEVAAAPTEEEAAKEPEVVGKGKKEEEGAEGAEAGEAKPTKEEKKK